jgi:hypothetical protein
MFAALKVPKAYFGYEGDLQGKATLAAEDIRFARTVERIQRIIESELTKIALVHLYAQGFKGESLTNFELTLTTPSVIYEQEKIALLKEKLDLADQMISSKLFPSDYVYDKLFSLSEDSYNEMRELVRQDAKRSFRLTQLENEGNDPAVSGISYGTPHDLASLYGRRSVETPKVPTGYGEETDNPEGRPREKFSIIGTQEDPLGGIDRLGTDGMKGGYPSDNDNVMERSNNTNIQEQVIGYKANTVLANNKDITSMFTSENKKNKINSSFMDETNIRDLENS